MKNKLFALIFCLASLSMFGQVLPSAVPLPLPEFQFFDSNGDPLSGGLLYTYAAGTSSPLATYTNSTGLVQNSNPIVLDSAGRASIWIGAAGYKLILNDRNGALQWTQDNVIDTVLYFVNYVKTAGTATLITYTNPISGAAQRTVSSRLSDRTDVRDFGAACDGVTDDTTAVQAAITNTASAGVTLYFPSGVCIVTALSLPTDSQIEGQGEALSIIRAKDASAVPGTPFIKNSNQSGGNSNISIRNIQFDGNVANQSLSQSANQGQEIPGISLIRVTNVLVDHVTIVNTPADSIFGYYWTNFTASFLTSYNYATKSYLFPNNGCIRLDYNGATGASSGINVFDSFCDGSVSHVGGIKIAGTSALPVTYVNVQRNTMIVGDANNGTGGNTLGIEIYSNSGAGFFDCTVSNNLIRGETSSSPSGATTGATWGISLAGAGGAYCTVSNNVIRWTGAYSIETGGTSHVSITGNTIDTAAQISVLGAPSSVTITGVSIVGNSIYNTIQFNAASTQVPSIFAYSQAGSVIHDLVVSGNTITYLVSPTLGGRAIWFQCNSGGGSVTDSIVSGNVIRGPGSGSTVVGIQLEQDAGSCPVERTQIRNNTMIGLSYGIFFGTDTDTQISGNVYSSTGSNYGGSIDSSDIFYDVIPSSNYVTAWSSITPSYSILFNKIGQYIQGNGGSATTPNIITWTNHNGGDCSTGGIFASNSRQNTQGDASPYGWTKTSSGAFARAGYYALGACAFTVGFGPATGVGPNPPADNNVLRVEDTSAHSGAATIGGVGIGQSGISSGSRIQQIWTASSSWNPGTITTLSSATTAPTVTGCAAGDMSGAALTTITTQVLVVSSTAKTDGVNVVVYNPTGGSITPGVGTLKVWCIHTDK